MSNEELNKKLAEWIGWKPDIGMPNMLPNFTTSLDACFEWLVPRPISEMRDLQLNSEKDNQWSIWIGMSPLRVNKVHGIKEYAKTPALALCLAIEKLIDKEVKK